MTNKKCVLLFVKYPEKGKVKTRLLRDLDENTISLLYENFVLDLLKTLGKGRHSLKICFYPPESAEGITNWLGNRYSYMPQKGKDLGERMKNAFYEAFSEGFERVLITGSDIPDLAIATIDDAFAKLSENDAVIGPSFDGGYYLIGFKNSTFLPGIFKNIQWGTDRVFQDTMDIFKKNHYKVGILPEWQDVDRLDDLKALFERNRDTEFAKSRTMAFLTKMQIL